MPNRYVPNYDDNIITGLSIDDCAQACVDQTSFICQSFEYQLIQGVCVLSHLHPDEHPGAIKSIVGTDLYISRWHLDWRFWLIHYILFIILSSIFHSEVKIKTGEGVIKTIIRLTCKKVLVPSLTRKCTCTNYAV